MKNSLLGLMIALGAASQASADIHKVTSYATVNVQDSVAGSTHWTNDNQYLIKGYVYVTAGSTLTIDSGTIIKGDKTTKGALIVERGAKIYALGTKDHPIIFTSNAPAGQRNYGDWGGIILCGSAPANWNSTNQQVEGGPRSLYGGTNPADNSGTLSYVRIEYPGIAFSANNEVNGLTLCGVGSGTQIDHIQVSYSGDDGIEWFGGTVNGKYIITYRTWDDDFDTDNGYSGKNQFLVSLRDPNIADVSGSKTFESDSYLGGTYSGIPLDTNTMGKSPTRCIFSNVTAIGPLLTPTSASSTNYVAGVQIRRGSALSLLNSVIVGYPAGLVIDESSSAYGSTSANIGNGLLQFRNNIIAGIPATSTNAPGGQKEIVYVKDGARNLTPTNTNADTVTGSPFSPAAGPFSWLKTPAYGNAIFATEGNGTKLFNPFNLSNPNMIPTSTSPIIFNTKGNGSATAGSFNPNNPINYDTSNGYANYNVPQVAPDFTNSKANDAFFTKVNHVGAFSGATNADNWMASWSNFDPGNTDYNYAWAAGGLSVGNTIASFSTVSVHPNPASQTAAVTIDVTSKTDMKITLADITGKFVALIYNGTLPLGEQSINIDLANLTAGMYFVNIATAGGQRTAKLSVVK